MTEQKQGWARKADKRIFPFYLRYHYFRKGDLFSLCSAVRIITNKVQFIDKEQGFFEDRKCKQCIRILKVYNDLNNFSHGNIMQKTLSRAEW